MFPRALLIGLYAALIVLLPCVIRASLPEGPWRWAWMPLLGVALVGSLQVFLGRKDASYSDRSPPAATQVDPGGDLNQASLGLADLLLSIHRWRPNRTSSVFRRRSLLSFFLSLFTGAAGAEGAAVEGAYGVLTLNRPGDARWLESRRRTDASMALAAGVAAAFQAPFAGILLALELGLGGSVLPVVVAAASAAWVVHFVLAELPLANLGSESMEIAPVFLKYRLASPSLWIGALLSAAFWGMVARQTTRVSRFFDRYFDLATGRRPLARLWIGAAGLTVTFIAVPHLMASQGALLEQLLWGRDALGEAIPWFFGTLFIWLWLSFGLGVGGVLWPLLFAGTVGTWVALTLLPGTWLGALGVEDSHLAILALSGGVALWAGVMGAPLSAVLLGVELTQQPGLLPFFGVIAWVAWGGARRWSPEAEPGWGPWVARRGLNLIGGRDEGVLTGITVREAMDRDLLVVHENESLQQLRDRTRETVHPFLAVVDRQGLYLGLISTDQILAAEVASRSLEARDLLGRSGSPRVGAVRSDEPLSVVAGRFSDFPCFPVIDVESRPVGLLFAHRFRSAYDGAQEKRAVGWDRG